MVGGVQAVSFPNSLWIGTDNTDNRPVLNTDRSGTELRRVDPPVEATGFAIDVAGNTIYFGTTSSGGSITPRDLDTLEPGIPFVPSGAFWEDMSFDGSRIWRADLVGGTVKKIDPATGAVEFEFSPGFGPMGVAWDGSHLWVSEFGSRVARFTTAGEPTGEEFTVIGFTAGGLAIDTTDNTLWIGTSGKVFHYTTTGTELGSFDVPVADGRFVDGLEFQTATTCLEAGTSRLVGQVKTTGGKPIPGVFVVLNGPEGCSDMKATGNIGRATFKGLANGSYTVTPSKIGCTFEPPGGVVTIDGNARATFTGTCP
jgi:hypothetical protein